jgi:hypothetical protein
MVLDLNLLTQADPNTYINKKKYILIFAENLYSPVKAPWG